MRNIEIKNGEVFIDGELWEEDDLNAVSEICERRNVKAEIRSYLSQKRDYYPDDEQVSEIMEYYFENKNYSVSFFQQIADAVNSCLYLEEPEEDNYNEEYDENY